MANPTQKRSKSRKRVKQYQHRIKKIELGVCPKCKKPKLKHRACSFCGTYAGKQALKMKTKGKDKKTKKKDEKRETKKDTKKVNTKPNKK